MMNINLIEKVNLEDILNTRDHSDVGYFVEVDLKYPYGIMEKIKTFPFCPENEVSPRDIFSEYMNEMIRDNNAPHKKINCD